MTSTLTRPHLDGENPWPGLESFQESERAFFGRDREADALLHHVLDAPVTVLYARSGLGKTSLLRAGLFPLLREQRLLPEMRFLPVWVRFEVKPGAAPLARQLHQFVRDAIRAELPDAVLPSDEESVWEYLHRRDIELRSADGNPLTPVIVLDQFEELFTLGEQTPDLVESFRNDFGDLAENRIPADLSARIEADDALAARFDLRSCNYKLLVSLREDYLPDLEGWCRLIPALGRSRMRLRPLQRDEAFDAVHEPAKDLMTAALAKRVVDIVAGENLHRDGVTAGADLDRPGNGQRSSYLEPALLSLFCRELNEERKRHGQERFEEQLVEGCESDILSNYYSSCVGDLPHVAKFVEDQLITEKGFRSNYARDDAVPSILTDDELNRLIGSRLLRIVDYHGTQRIELTHDVLTKVVREHRDRRRAEELQARAQEAEAEQRRQQAALESSERNAAKLRRLSRVLGALLAVVVVLAIVAYVSVLNAKNSERQAQESLRSATVQKLVADAQGMLSGTLPGGDARAFDQILAAHSIAQQDATNGDAADDALYTAVAQRANTKRILSGHRGPVESVVFSPDGRTLATASDDHWVRLWNAETGQPIGAPLTGHTGDVYSVVFSPDGRTLASGSWDHSVRLWNAETGQPIGAPLTGHTGEVNSVVFSPDGRMLASGSWDNTVRLWNAETGQPIGAPLTGHKGRVYCVVFSPDGRMLASGSEDRTVRLWNAETGQPIGAPLTGHTGEVYSVAFSPDGRTLASGSDDRTVRLWNAETGQLIGVIDGDIGTVYSLAFSRDGYYTLAAGGSDQTVRLWNGVTGLPIGAPLVGHTGPVNSVAFSPDGHTLASGSNDHSVRLWSVDNGQPLPDATMVAFSPDGHKFASGSWDHSVQLWNAETGQPIGAPLTGHTGAVLSVAFSPDGHTLATASDDHSVRLWNAETGQPIGAPLTGHTGAVRSVAFSPDGRTLASGSDDHSVRLWNAETGQPIGAPLTGHTGEVYSVAFSPDGRTLASGSDDRTVRLWNAQTGQPIGAPLTGHTYPVFSVVFSPNGQIIASGSSDQTVRLWNVGTGQQIGEPLTGHTGAVLSVAFSPDGRRLASGGDDQTVRLWNVGKGQPIGNPLTAHTERVYSVAFSSDGHTLTTVSWDHTAWKYPTDASPQMLCAKLTSNPSHDEWREWVSPDIKYTELCPGLPIEPDA